MLLSLLCVFCGVSFVVHVLEFQCVGSLWVGPFVFVACGHILSLLCSLPSALVAACTHISSSTGTFALLWWWVCCWSVMKPERGKIWFWSPFQLPFVSKSCRRWWTCIQVLNNLFFKSTQAETCFKENSESSQNTHERKLSFRNAATSQASYEVDTRALFLSERA